MERDILKSHGLLRQTQQVTFQFITGGEGHLSDADALSLPWRSRVASTYAWTGEGRRHACKRMPASRRSYDSAQPIAGGPMDGPDCCTRYARAGIAVSGETESPV